MQDPNLFKVSLIISVIGTFLILLISEYSEVELTKIQELNKKQLETRVRVEGTILSVRETPGLYILKIKDSSASIPIIVFKEESLELERNAQIEVIGKLTEYKNEFEIIAEKIKI
mgnify:CR=1 FL=1